MARAGQAVVVALAVADELRGAVVDIDHPQRGAALAGPERRSSRGGGSAAMGSDSRTSSGAPGARPAPDSTRASPPSRLTEKTASPAWRRSPGAGPAPGWAPASSRSSPFQRSQASAAPGRAARTVAREAAAQVDHHHGVAAVRAVSIRARWRPPGESWAPRRTAGWTRSAMGTGVSAAETRMGPHRRPAPTEIASETKPARTPHTLLARLRSVATRGRGATRGVSQPSLEGEAVLSGPAGTRAITRSLRRTAAAAALDPVRARQ